MWNPGFVVMLLRDLRFYLDALTQNFELCKDAKHPQYNSSFTIELEEFNSVMVA